MRRCAASSIGIGSMILFIAMLLVAAMISATILIMMEKGFKDQATTADKTEGRGQILIESIFIYRFQPCWVDQYVSFEPDCGDAPVGNQRPWGHHQLAMFFHLGPGSTDTETKNIHYLVRCIDEGITDLDNDGTNDGREVTRPVFSSDFAGSDTAQQNAQGVGVGDAFENGFPTLQQGTLRVSDLEYGKSYKIKLELFDNMNNNGADEDRFGCRISLDYDTQLLIMVEGGRSTQTTLHFRSLETGQLVI